MNEFKNHKHSNSLKIQKNKKKKEEEERRKKEIFSYLK